VCPRVYKNFDPRAKIIREIADEVFDIAGRDPLIDVAVALEKAARNDEFFIKRNLYPNVDFYSGEICHCVWGVASTMQSLILQGNQMREIWVYPKCNGLT